MKVRAHLIVSGLVHGVSFRYSTRLKALETRVTGWIRNLPGGRVEVVFEGKDDSVKEMVEFCRNGPPNAFVENVNVKWEDFKGETEDFEIRY